MSPRNHLGHTYRVLMRHHPFGYALYQPLLRDSESTKAKPGVCGILDDRGIWTPLFDLNDPPTLSEHQLCPAEDTSERLIRDGLRWEPMLSRGATKVNAGLGVTFP